MIASRISGEQLEQAAQAVGVTLDKSAMSESGSRWRVKVNPGKPNAYPRVSPRDGRRVHAVCWHGFRDFFRAAFKLAPTARFSTALDTWDGAEDFEERFQQSGVKNAGSLMNPMPNCCACECKEEGYCG